MKEKLFKLMQEKRDVLLYLIFGVLTTVINYIVYFLCLDHTQMSAATANMVAWVVAVVFAFVTNKPIVFQSHDWSMSVTLPELVKFMSTRIASGLMETGILFVVVDTLHWNGYLWKLITNVLVVIVNYIGSKLFVFKNK